MRSLCSRLSLLNRQLNLTQGTPKENDSIQKVVFYSARILSKTLPKMSAPALRPSPSVLKDLEESLVLLIFNAPYFHVSMCGM
jgi:hypothetical protein